MKGFLLILSCALCAGCPSGRQSTDTQARLKNALETVRVESRRYYSLEVLPGRKQLQDAAESGDGEAWRRLTPVERFFVFGVSPKIRAAAGSAMVAEAYCAALGTVPAEYWGTPDNLDNPSAHEFVALGKAVQPCLKSRLTDTVPLSFKDGEANMFTEEFAWTVGDQAAGLLAAILSVPYGARRPAAERRAVKERMANDIK